MTINKVSSLLYLKHGTYKNVETGVAPMSVNEHDRLCELFKVRSLAV